MKFASWWGELQADVPTAGTSGDIKDDQPVYELCELWAGGVHAHLAVN
jgi:hypothetical protein